MAINAGSIRDAFLARRNRTRPLLVMPEPTHVENPVADTPAPVEIPPVVTERDLLVSDMLALFPEHYASVIRNDTNGFSGETLASVKICAEAIASNRSGDVSVLLLTISEVSKGLLPEMILTYFAQRVDRMSEALGFAALKYLYLSTMDSQCRPVSDEVFEAHMYGVTNYSSHLTEPTGLEKKYMANGPLMALVSRLPDKVDLIVRHHAKYYVVHPWDPEEQRQLTEYRLDILEDDLDELAEVHDAVVEGWL